MERFMSFYKVIIFLMVVAISFLITGCGYYQQFILPTPGEEAPEIGDFQIFPSNVSLYVDKPSEKVTLKVEYEDINANVTEGGSLVVIDIKGDLTDHEERGPGIYEGDGLRGEIGLDYPISLSPDYVDLLEERGVGGHVTYNVDVEIWIQDKAGNKSNTELGSISIRVPIPKEEEDEDSEWPCDKKCCFVDANGNPVDTARPPTTIYFQVLDLDSNRSPSTTQSLDIQIHSIALGDWEVITIEEKGTDSGHFWGPIVIEYGDTPRGDGRIGVETDDTVEGRFEDPNESSDFCTAWVQISGYHFLRLGE